MHLIIEGIDTVYTPKGNEFEATWHGLQTPVDNGIAIDGGNCPEVFQPIVQAGFKPDFECEVAKDVPKEIAEYVGANPMTDWKVILADLRKAKYGKVIPLHVAKSGYQIHQNKVLFDAFIASAKNVLGDKGFEIATLMTLGAFSQFACSIAIKGKESGFEIGKGDKWATFYNLVSSHNGLVASQRHLSMVRMVCMNTVQAAIASAECQAMLKHTANSLELITPEVFTKDLQAWIEAKQAYKLTLQALKAEKMTVDQFKAFASGVFTLPESDELSTTSYNRVNELVPVFQRGTGNKGENRYDAINAFTEYFTSGNGVGNPDRVKLNKRIASANFGRGNQWKLEALRVASNPEEFATACKRGEILFTDKAKAEVGAN